MDLLDKSDIEEAFKGKLWTYVAIATSTDHKIGVAVANEQGYSPVPYNMTRDCGDRYDERRAYCITLNQERDQDEVASMNIICSTMRKGRFADKPISELEDVA